MARRKNWRARFRTAQRVCRRRTRPFTKAFGACMRRQLRR